MEKEIGTELAEQSLLFWYNLSEGYIYTVLDVGWT